MEKCNYCNKEKEGIQTGLCNHCGKFGKRDQELALEWWNKLPKSFRIAFCAENYRKRGKSSLTDSKIEEIWSNEIKQL